MTTTTDERERTRERLIELANQIADNSIGPVIVNIVPEWVRGNDPVNGEYEMVVSHTVTIRYSEKRHDHND